MGVTQSLLRSVNFDHLALLNTSIDVGLCCFSSVGVTERVLKKKKNQNKKKKRHKKGLHLK